MVWIPKFGYLPQETITQKSLEIIELERERRHLQRELAVVSKGYRNVSVEAQTDTRPQYGKISIPFYQKNS